MAGYLDNVAIIGGGLGGCALALALSLHNIPVTVYESRPQGSDVLKSGVILTPNGLWVLDQLGVFSRIKDRCYTTTYRVFKNDKDETTRKTIVSHEDLYGYRNHRIWRKLLLDEMKKMMVERSIPIHYDSKFNGIVSDHSDGVTFSINQSNQQASMLIGSDGIYSSVRKHVAGDVVLEYTGLVGILAHIKRKSVAWPYEDYERNATIQGKPGAIFFLPEDPEAEDIMIGMQVQYPEQSRGDLERLQTDYDKLAGFFQKGYEEHGPTARSIIDRVTENKEDCLIWPYMKMPKLDRWYSNTGRVICMGDGAHALPPSSGQGVNQALEDAYSLTLILDAFAHTDTKNTNTNNPSENLNDALSFWQTMRQKRIDSIFEWITNDQNVQRMPEADRKKLIAEGKIKESESNNADDMSWLYRPTLEGDVKAWTAS